MTWLRLAALRVSTSLAKTPGRAGAFQTDGVSGCSPLTRPTSMKRPTRPSRWRETPSQRLIRQRRSYSWLGPATSHCPPVIRSPTMTDFWAALLGSMIGAGATLGAAWLAYRGSTTTERNRAERLAVGQV